jgi:hypothetical protein
MTATMTALPVKAGLGCWWCRNLVDSRPTRGSDAGPKSAPKSGREGRVTAFPQVTGLRERSAGPACNRRVPGSSPGAGPVHDAISEQTR